MDAAKQLHTLYAEEVQGYVENTANEKAAVGIKMDLTTDDFEGAILKNKQSLAVVFTANWCPFCRMFLPVFESSLSEKKLPYATVDLTSYDNPLWETFEIGVVPTVVIFKNGQVTYRADGKYGRGLSNNVMDDVIREFGLPLD